METIRKGVFETNSSSTHSVSISGGPGAVMEVPLLAEDGYLDIRTGEYGWERAWYSEVDSRLGYATTCILNYAYDIFPSFLEMVKEVTGAKGIRVNGEIIESIEQMEEIAKEKEKERGCYYAFGYIDHQSVEGGDDILGVVYDPIRLKQFLFNQGSHFETDNDNG